MPFQIGAWTRSLTASGVEWCLLGPARMHHTLVTGEIIGKEAAGEHALESFPEHARIVGIALARVRGDAMPKDPSREEWRSLTALAMQAIITDALANDLT